MSSVRLRRIYNKLFDHFGPQHWWPGDSTFEIIVGAILTQNTNWQNVKKAIANLKNEKVLKPKTLLEISQNRLARLIRPAGYFNVKARRLKSFLEFLFTQYKGSLAKMGKTALPQLRQELLSVHGIGPETADSILLYAFNQPSFVIDTYTKRVFSRYGLVDAGIDYHDLQQYFTNQLQEDVQLYNEYHALIVNLGKNFCKPKPKCAICPLSFGCKYPQTSL